MPKEGNQPANNNAEVKRLMMESVAGNKGGEQKLAPVNEASEGSESDDETEERSKAKRELNDEDYADNTASSDEKEEEDSAASEDKKEEDSDTNHPVIYFYENNDSSGVRNGCAFDNFCVRVEGRERYALVGPTPITGGAIVCAAAAIVPSDPDRFGVEDVFVITRTCVCLMTRGRDIHVCYAAMDSDEHTDEAGVTMTYT